MGGCLCKSKTLDDLPDNLSQSGRHSADYGRTYGRHSDRCDETLSETVDRLVKETLKVIGSVVDSDPEPPRVCFLIFHFFLSFSVRNIIFFSLNIFIFSR